MSASLPKWSVRWLEVASKGELEQACAEAEKSLAYVSGVGHFTATVKWERRLAIIRKALAVPDPDDSRAAPAGEG